MPTQEIMTLTTEDISMHVDSGDSVPLIRGAAPLTVGFVEAMATDTVVILSADHREQAQDIIDKSLDAFEITEDTLTQDLTGRPTLVARLDATIDNGKIVPYECEERPAGLGVIDMLMHRANGVGIREKLHQHVGHVTGRELVALHTLATRNDDEAVMPIHSVSQFPQGVVVMNRIKGENVICDQFHKKIASVSISTVRDEGDKRYMLEVPEFNARTVSVGDLPDSGVSFVLKEPRGSRAEGVHAYLSAADRRVFGKGRTITHSRASQLVKEIAGITVEPLKPPVPVGSSGNMILRVLALVSADEVEVIGGAFCIEEHIKVSGSHVATGAVLCE